nr:hypothetical protein [Tanacetum cinerariifolium]
MVAASKVPMLKLSKYKIWRIKIEQYIQMIDYALWEVIENADLDTISMDDLNNNLKVYEPEVKGMSSSSSSTQNMAMAFVSSSNNNTSTQVITAQAVNTAHEVSTASTQVNVVYSTNIDNLSDVVIFSFFASQPNSPQLVHEDLEQIHPNDMEEMDLRWKMAVLTMRARRFLKKTRMKHIVNGNETIGFDKSNVECYNCHKRGHFARECRAPKNQDNKHKESSKRSVPMKTSTFVTLVSCDGLGGYDKSDQAEEGPNYALVAFSSLSYKTGLESVEERLKFYKANKSIYLEDIKVLKVEIQIGEIAIRELRKKLEIAQKEKDGIQLNVDKFKHASKSLNKLIEYQIADNCKKGLGYKNYHVVLPPYIGNSMPPTPDLSFIGLDEFVNKLVVENCKAKSNEEEPKVVRKKDDAPIIKEWVSDNKEEDVSQPKIKKKTMRISLMNTITTLSKYGLHTRFIRSMNTADSSCISEGANLYGAWATGAAPGTNSIWNSTWRTGGRPCSSPGKNFRNSLITGTYPCLRSGLDERSCPIAGMFFHGHCYLPSVPSQMTHLVASITLDSARSCVMQDAFLTQETISSIPIVLSWGGSIRPEGFRLSILLLTVIIAMVSIVVVVVLVIVDTIIGIVVVVFGEPFIIRLAFVITGWMYAFHQDKASSVRVPVANVTLFFSAAEVEEDGQSRPRFLGGNNSSGRKNS